MYLFLAVLLKYSNTTSKLSAYTFCYKFDELSQFHFLKLCQEVYLCPKMFANFPYNNNIVQLLNVAIPTLPILYIINFYKNKHHIYNYCVNNCTISKTYLFRNYSGHNRIRPKKNTEFLNFPSLSSPAVFIGFSSGKQRLTRTTY